MVEDDPAALHDPDCIPFGLRLVTEARADVADDDIVGGYLERVVAKRDATAWCRLPRDRHLAFANAQRGRELDGSGNGEHDRTRAPGVDRSTQAAGTGIVEIGDRDDFSA